MAVGAPESDPNEYSYPGTLDGDQQKKNRAPPKSDLSDQLRSISASLSAAPIGLKREAERLTVQRQSLTRLPCARRVPTRFTDGNIELTALHSVWGSRLTSNDYSELLARFGATASCVR